MSQNGIDNAWARGEYVPPQPDLSEKKEDNTFGYVCGAVSLGVGLIFGAKWSFLLLVLVVWIFLALIAWGNFLGGSNGGWGGR